ncbi:MAG TPA: hypothetical protein VEG64_03950 [Candidatus Sulfotelmatobacter sp.]|nr:hypothetical protein [Candidatus Sulfotelmatobacter sp.]
MTIQLKRGTALDGRSLCESCLHAHLVRGFRENEEMVVCQATYPGERIPFRVRECSGFAERQRQTLSQMEKIAWVLTPKGVKRQAGFAANGDQSKDRDEIELLLEDQE